jgi:predicted dehydrogenase
VAAQSNDSARTVRVAVLGAGAWARLAHIPGFKRDARCEVVAICDPQRHMAEALAAEFGIPSVYSDHREVLAREDIDLIDVCTPSATHFELSWAALEAGKHVLCEKPVAFDFRDTIRAAELAKSKGLKTKLGFTFRYAPAMRYMKQPRRRRATSGTPFIFNGYEQNSQWLDPMNPLRQVDRGRRPERSCTCRRSKGTARRSSTSRASCRRRRAVKQVVGTMRNFIPDRMVRATGARACA